MTGEIQRWDLGGWLELRFPEASERRVKSRDLVELTFDRPEERSSGAWTVRTHDGGRIIGEIEDGDATCLRMTHAFLGVIAVPLEVIGSIEHRSAGESSHATADVDSDQVDLANGDVAHGTVISASRDGLTILAGDSERDLAWSVIRRARFRVVDSPQADRPVALLTFVDETRLPARQVRWRPESTKAEVFRSSLQFASRRLRGTEITGGRHTWLASMRPAHYESRLFFGGQVAPGVDANASGGPLRLGGQTYRHGLGLHSFCRIQFDLKGEFEQFVAKVGVDSAAGPLADASVEIQVDDRSPVRFEHLDSRSDPRSIDLDVRAAKSLTIQVDYGHRGDVQDLINLVDAAVVRK